jgi:starvation-inducible DNA-binding protein
VTTVLEPTLDRARLTAVSTLQRLLAPLVALKLDAKQAHWNMYGPEFLAAHDLTDELAAELDRFVDRLAERAAALGFAVDARADAVAAAGSSLPAGRLTVEEAAHELAAALAAVAVSAHEGLEQLDEADPVTHDLLVGLIEQLDHYGWLFRSRLAR